MTDMDSSERLGKLNEYYAAFGRFIMMWNQAEYAMRGLLSTMCGRNYTTHILTAELGARGLEDALKAIAETKHTDVQKVVDRLTGLFSELREYRNYYTHGIHVVHEKTPGNWVGVAATTSAKSKLAYSYDLILIDSLTEMHNRAMAIRDSAYEVADSIEPPARSESRLPLPSLETLPRPIGRLQKSLSYPLRD